MGEFVVLDHWMTIGRSSQKSSFISPKGRIQTGEKGIGRFALDRIADKCQGENQSGHGGRATLHAERLHKAEEHESVDHKAHKNVLFGFLIHRDCLPPNP